MAGVGGGGEMSTSSFPRHDCNARVRSLVVKDQCSSPANWRSRFTRSREWGSYWQVPGSLARFASSGLSPEETSVRARRAPSLLPPWNATQTALPEQRENTDVWDSGRAFRSCKNHVLFVCNKLTCAQSSKPSMIFFLYRRVPSPTHRSPKVTAAFSRTCSRLIRCINVTLTGLMALQQGQKWHWPFHFLSSIALCLWAFRWCSVLSWRPCPHSRSAAAAPRSGRPLPEPCTLRTPSLRESSPTAPLPSDTSQCSATNKSKGPARAVPLGRHVGSQLGCLRKWGAVFVQKSWKKLDIYLWLWQPQWKSHPPSILELHPSPCLPQQLVVFVETTRPSSSPKPALIRVVLRRPETTQEQFQTVTVVALWWQKWSAASCTVDLPVVLCFPSVL